MSVLFRRLLLLLAMAGIGCSAPYPFLSAGELAGDVAPIPSDWSFAGEYGTAQLETKPGAPYSVNLNYTILDEALYINAGDTETQWVQNMVVNPLVRLRLEGVIYELRAERVTETADIARFAKAWTSQSMFRRDPSDVEEVWIYRLRAR